MRRLVPLLLLVVLARPLGAQDSGDTTGIARPADAQDAGDSTRAVPPPDGVSTPTDSTGGHALSLLEMRITLESTNEVQVTLTDPEQRESSETANGIPHCMRNWVDPGAVLFGDPDSIGSSTGDSLSPGAWAHHGQILLLNLAVPEPGSYRLSVSAPAAAVVTTDVSGSGRRGACSGAYHSTDSLQAGTSDLRFDIQPGDGGGCVLRFDEGR